MKKIINQAPIVRYRASVSEIFFPDFWNGTFSAESLSLQFCIRRGTCLSCLTSRCSRSRVGSERGPAIFLNSPASSLKPNEELAQCAPHWLRASRSLFADPSFRQLSRGLTGPVPRLHNCDCSQRSSLDSISFPAA